MWQLRDIKARVARLQELARGLAKEAAVWKKGEDPLLYLERKAYLNAMLNALAGLETGAVNLDRWLNADTPALKEHYGKKYEEMRDAKKLADSSGVATEGPEYEEFIRGRQRAYLEQADKVKADVAPQNAILNNRGLLTDMTTAAEQEKKKLRDAVGVDQTRAENYDKYLPGPKKAEVAAADQNKFTSALMMALPSIKGNAQYTDIEGAHKRVQMAAIADDPITVELKRMQQDSLKQIIDNQKDIPDYFKQVIEGLRSAGLIQ